MREIEIKAHVSCEMPQLLALCDELRLELSPPIRQLDRIFVRAPYGLRDISGSQAPIVRIRVQESVDREQLILMTLKRDLTDQLDSIEHTTEVSSLDASVAILEEMGFHSVLTIQKARRQGSLGRFNICVDDVPILGIFIELEAMCDTSEDPVSIRAEMWQALGLLGVGEENAVTVGYDRLFEQYVQDRMKPE